MKKVPWGLVDTENGAPDVGVAFSSTPANAVTRAPAVPTNRPEIDPNFVKVTLAGVVSPGVTSAAALVEVSEYPPAFAVTVYVPLARSPKITLLHVGAAVAVAMVEPSCFSVKRAPLTA